MAGLKKLFRAIKVGNKSLKSETEEGARGALFSLWERRFLTHAQLVGEVGNKRLRALAAGKRDPALAIIGLPAYAWRYVRVALNVNQEALDRKRTDGADFGCYPEFDGRGEVAVV